MMKFILTCLITGLLLSASVAGASAHSLTVDPPGQDPTLEDEMVSQPFAQAHCEAEAPEKATANSEVITFSPAKALDDCEPGEGQPGGN